ncbi:hypothetical protein CTI12_AA461010 [Artemisia annua]|uniref:Retrotransposon gag domain-containing protein n=1 Tax=Artemisia annua TaxID=35608 RepID=A0A2U1LRZ0_ARTAN|nr:hypothetical protein CTI12_AA461010 [Artemisia annua]
MQQITQTLATLTPRENDERHNHGGLRLNRARGNEWEVTGERFGCHRHVNNFDYRQRAKDIPSFHGSMNVEDFVDWMSELHNFFKFYEIPMDQRVIFVAYKLKVGAQSWWKNMQITRERQGKLPITSRERMERELRRRFLPPNHDQILFNLLQHCAQGDRTVEVYTAEFHRLSSRNNLSETESQQVTRYINGLRPQIHDKISLDPVYTLDDAYNLAIRAENQLAKSSMQIKSVPSIDPSSQHTTKISTIDTGKQIVSTNTTTTKPPNPYARPVMGKCFKYGVLGHRLNECRATGGKVCGRIIEMTTTATCMHIAISRPSNGSFREVSKSSIAVFGSDARRASGAKFNSSCHISSTQSLSQNVKSSPSRFGKMTTKAMSDSNNTKVLPGLPVDLRGKRAFIAGIADDNGYGWAIAKSLAAAGAEILVGTWVPALNIFESSLRRGKFDESRVLPDGSLMNITKVYPLDAVYDTPEDVPDDVKSNKRYAGSSKWTIKEVAECVKEDFGSIDILVHSLANGPEVKKHLSDTSRNGYLAAISASSYSFISLLQYFVPMMNPGIIFIAYFIFGGVVSSLRRGKFDESRVLPDGSLMNITKVYPLDAVYDTPEDVPDDVKSNKRYAGSSKWTIKEVAECVKEDFGSIDILVHSLANGPEVKKRLSDTSRNGYLAAISASSYSFISLLQYFVPMMNPVIKVESIAGGATISLSFNASERVFPGYGGGMSSAKAALESDTKVSVFFFTENTGTSTSKVLAFETGRKYGIRVNAISAGPLKSRAATVTGLVEKFIDYSFENAPLQKELFAEEVGNAAAFLASPLASAITGTVMFVDNGLNIMGIGLDSPVFNSSDIPKDLKGGATISLSFYASERVYPGYGGGMSSAKAADMVESDTKVSVLFFTENTGTSTSKVFVLAFETGRKYGIRVNAISAGPLKSRAATVTGLVEKFIDYSFENAPLQKELFAEEVGNAAAFLASPLASAITGTVMFVDNGLNIMGIGLDSPVFNSSDIPKDLKG